MLVFRTATGSLGGLRRRLCRLGCRLLLLAGGGCSLGGRTQNVITPLPIDTAPSDAAQICATRRTGNRRQVQCQAHPGCAPIPVPWACSLTMMFICG